MLPSRRTLSIAPNVLSDLCSSAVRLAGASHAAATALAKATVGAELRGRPAVGVSHLFDYLDAFNSGRANVYAEPAVSRTRAATTVVDADAGLAQHAFHSGIEALFDGVTRNGMGMLSIRNAYSAGELAYYTHAVGERGFVAIAMANSPALMSVYGSTQPVTGTNPLSFALPHPNGPRLFDQASSVTAWVSIREAAERRAAIPEGWALDAEGAPTSDASAALEGAMLPFGGVKGANIAVMVEMLSVLGGAAFSVDAAPFDRGNRPPQLGLSVIAVDPNAFDENYVDRAEAHHRRLQVDYGVDFGRRKSTPRHIEIDEELLARLRARSERST